MTDRRTTWVLLALLGISAFAVSAQADTILYQENFNSYADATSMASVPGWYQWSGAAPVITGGTAIGIVGGAQDMLLDFPKLFSHDNTEARVEFDMRGGHTTDLFIGSGTASSLDFNYNNCLAGWENGANYNSPNLLFTPTGGPGFYDQSAQNWTTMASGTERHYVVNLTLSGTTVTWTATVDGNNLIGGGKTSESFELTDSRGLNTIEWYQASYSDFPYGQTPPYAQATIDNIVITDIGGSQPPSFHPGDINGDGTVDLQDFGVLKDNFGLTEGAVWAAGDLTGDGAVDLQDFGVLKDHFGHTNGDSPVNAVPEPATLSLLALGALAALRRKAR